MLKATLEWHGMTQKASASAWRGIAANAPMKRCADNIGITPAASHLYNGWRRVAAYREEAKIARATRRDGSNGVAARTRGAHAHLACRSAGIGGVSKGAWQNNNEK